MGYFNFPLAGLYWQSVHSLWHSRLLCTRADCFHRHDISSFTKIWLELELGMLTFCMRHRLHFWYLYVFHTFWNFFHRSTSFSQSGRSHNCSGLVDFGHFSFRAAQWSWLIYLLGIQSSHRHAIPGGHPPFESSYPMQPQSETSWIKSLQFLRQILCLTRNQSSVRETQMLEN